MIWKLDPQTPRKKWVWSCKYLFGECGVAWMCINWSVMLLLYVCVWMCVVKSFVEMVKYLLSQPGADLFLLSERFTQDPLENYFGKQHSRGRRNDNPNFKECLQDSIAIRAQKFLELDRVQGNCRRKRSLPDSCFQIDDTPLPKRKRKSLRISKSE